jgi:hypothetical protein
MKHQPSRRLLLPALCALLGCAHQSGDATSASASSASSASSAPSASSSESPATAGPPVPSPKVPDVPGSPLGPMGADAAGALNGYLLKLKCGAAQDSRSCKLSSDQERSRLDVKLAGDADKLYEVRLRVQGLVEPRRYLGGQLVDPANKWLYAGGEPDPSKKNNGQAYNIYQVAVSEPKAHYFLNRDTDNNLGGGYTPSHSIFKIDYPLVLKVKGGATISVITDDQARSGMINNADKQVVEGLPADVIPQPWDGQFFHITVESVAPAAG